MRPLALVGLGSNLADRKVTLDGAVAALVSLPGVNLQAVSAFHETTPIGGPSGQQPFLNAVAALEPSLDPFQLLEALHGIERQFGRERSVHWGQRSLDLDLILYSQEVWFTPELTLPHPRFACRRFVLAPALEVAPHAIDPITGQSIRQLLTNLDRRPGLVCIDELDATHGSADSTLLTDVQDRLCQRLGALAIKKTRSREPLEGSNITHLQEAHFAALKSSADRLQAQHWRVRDHPNQWLVADFSLEQQTRLGNSLQRRAALDKAQKGPEPESLARIKKITDLAVVRALTPTFVVLIAGTAGCLNPLSGFSSPVLMVMSDDPEQITQEILITCQATRNG